MKSKEFVVAGAVLTLVAYTLTLSFAGEVFSATQTSRKVSNSGTIVAVGVGVYSDSGCTKPLSSFDWGMLDPGSSKDESCYIRNEGNSALTLSMSTSNWSPSDASSYMSLSWDYAGQSLNPDEAIKVTFTLSVSASIDGITSFSFDITIVGTG